MRGLLFLLPLSVVAIFAAVISCSSSSPPVVMVKPVSGDPSLGSTASYVNGGSYRSVMERPRKRPGDLLGEVNVYKDIIPRGVHARKYKRYMKPRYITIHSTQNFSSGADAMKHSLALKNGALRAYKRKGGNRIGYLVWHYSVDQTRAVQHLPTNEQGEHADFSGPGNLYSIGIEMCENRGNSRSKTIERTAKLTAYLMHQHKIPLKNVVPHYHWARKGLSKPHKNCPHYLLDNGRPGKKWRWYQGRVKHYHDQITSSSPRFAGI
ncbi:peptidoglycan recognition protein family protein [Rubritalea profundi]|uniref:N-acetylmuramoyl-L-alanine amidase n=1 Tax=Rubritalea profundi TaxID=1658618 RepID=A0A2S7U0D3_9BACT|nr:N-acetylmuramoyl-L-alanine amidase [Rubritalea profundi]PQJ27967.1 N-acetylmuramoyl-L-alanine amidase [Rubritalea profundi]